MKTTAYLSLIIASIFTYSCASPIPIAKLEAIDPESSYWQQGMEIVTLTNDSLDVEMGYLRREGAHYLFDLTITNRRSMPVLIDPTNFFYQPIFEQNRTEAIVRAENPENHILFEEKRLAQLEADSRNNAISSLVVGTVELAAAVATSTEDENDDQTYARNYTEEEIRIDYETQNAINQRSYWETSALRKTTLFPNHYVQGLVFMKWNRTADQIWVLIPVDDQEFEFRYNQILHPSYHRPPQ